MVKNPRNRANICIDCERACGGCSWSEVDPLTDQIRWQPVPGWTAEPVYKQVGTKAGGKRQIVDTYCITDCPLFVGSEYKIRQDYNQLTPAQSDWFLENISRILREWDDE